MRYLDWDVLLFPASEEGSAYIPLKEFKTAIYVEHPEPNSSSPYPVPLLTTFIPSLPANAPFQISVHSWRQTGPVLKAFSAGSKIKELFVAKVIVDGVCVGTKYFDCDAVWPQIVSSTSSPSMNGDAIQLRFPPFHREIISQSYWNAADRTGRIRVELSAGYTTEKSDRFEKTADLISFAFQHAPLGNLEHSGIAWPNKGMHTNPRQATTQHGFLPVSFMDATAPVKHRKAASAGNFASSQPAYGFPMQRPASPNNPFKQDTASNYDASSRSTSAYSTMTDSAAPLLTQGFHQPMSNYPGMYSDGARRNVQPTPFRLPSDQLQMIINALSPASHGQHGDSPAATMGPPPLPAHALASKGHDEGVGLNNGSTIVPQFSSEVVNFIDRRAESRYSDVSMHNNCTSFPTCTTEDAEGHIVHNNHSAPAAMVKGRKEGSSPTKPRDFFSTILDTTAPPTSATEQASETTTLGLLSSSSPPDTQSKKRARSALKLLNINDGSPEKNEAATTMKPPRKASRVSMSLAHESNKENVADGQEDVMVDS